MKKKTKRKLKNTKKDYICVKCEKMSRHRLLYRHGAMQITRCLDCGNKWWIMENGR